ncbi:hypothetical protein HDU78_004315 [Chytriomyces hyalinus]|nr:hypothetical protein HDU78_004315 [Chytriomyces hyalinus]
MEDGLPIENGTENCGQEAESSSKHLEIQQAEESFPLDEFSFQIPSSGQSFSFTQSPLRGSPSLLMLGDLQHDEFSRNEDPRVPITQTESLFSIDHSGDEQPGHESLKDRSVLSATPLDEVKEQPALQLNPAYTGEESTRPTTIKRETVLVFADKRTPKTSIQQWASMFGIKLNIYAANSNPKANEARLNEPAQCVPASASPAPHNMSAQEPPTIRVVHKQTEWSVVSKKHSDHCDFKDEMSQAVLEFMKYVQGMWHCGSVMQSEC